MRRLVPTPFLVAVVGVCLLLAAQASARTVSYHGLRVTVPAGWPVFRLAAHPHVCVRFNRHAVYIGRPGANERCPVAALGRTEAILLSPRAVRIGGRAMQFRAGRVVVTATWNRAPGMVSRALHRRVRVTHASPPRALERSASAARVAQAAGTVFTGLGFDACAAPSEIAMQAWRPSYGAAGIYIGGANMACAQANLTSTWVGDQTAAGWRFIATYVGLQAPLSGCSSCASIIPAKAGTEGTAAAIDALTQAQTLGIGPQNPIYFDMEAYDPTTTSTPAVLTFLSAWTTQLHASQYLSGVYSSSDSGIRDIAAAAGTSFVEPDELWIANWNGQQSTADPNVPSTEFATHDRLHQYAGAHNETHGRTTINIDSDYLDGATAAGSVLTGGGIPVPAAAPRLALTPAVNGTVGFHASWPGVDTIAAWQVLAGTTPETLAPYGAPLATTGDAVLTVHSQFPYFAAEALDISGQPFGASAPVATPAHVAIYGRSAFVGTHGNGTLPVGCFTGHRCVVSTTITAAHKVLARTGGEVVPTGGGRLLHFSLTPAGRAALAAVRARRLAVRVITRDTSGVTADAPLNLVGFATSGRGPSRSLSDAPALRLFGASEFVFRRRTGGVLAGCFAPAPCNVQMTLTAGRTTIAATQPQTLGANELGYLRFVLTARGRALMASAKGNQLGVRVALTDSVAGAQAAGDVVLISYR